MKKNSIILILAAILFVAIVYSMTSCMREQNIYPATGKIIGLNRETDVVTFETFNGHRFQFFGCEDYSIGDSVSVVMDRNGTETVTDDIVVFAYYAGWDLERWQ